MNALDQELGKVRDLTNQWLAGGPRAPEAMRDLFQLLLGCTILADGAYVRLISSKDRSASEWALGGPAGPLDPLPLRDGRWLKLSASIYLDDRDERGPLLKVRQSSYQYQDDKAGGLWVCRYDYLRERRGDAHPTGHLQINGQLEVPGLLSSTFPLGRIHFPTGRIAIEAVIWLLIGQFGVPTRTRPEWWRPLLTASEASFHDVAHKPESGPPT